jgi:O-antigen ligase
MGIPLTFAAFFLGGLGGRFFFILVAGGMGVLHFAMDFRSVGGICLLIAGAAVLQVFPRHLRLWVVPFICAGALAAVSLVYTRMQDEDSRRGTRSDVARSSMMQAAWEAFAESPVIGQGSWFNKSKLYDNFAVILEQRARDASIGGFGGANSDVTGVAIHSQILVTLAEGGLFGATFFFVYAGMLVWALWNEVLVRAWDRISPVRLLQLFLAFWNVWLSPYSGAHRVYIAAAVGIILILRWDHEEQDEEAEET